MMFFKVSISFIGFFYKINYSMFFWAYLIFQLWRNSTFFSNFDSSCLFTLTTQTFQQSLSQKLWLILQYTFCCTFNFIQINHFHRQHSKKIRQFLLWTFKSDIKQLVLPNRHMVTNYNSHVSVQLPITAAALAIA